MSIQPTHQSLNQNNFTDGQFVKFDATAKDFVGVDAPDSFPGLIISTADGASEEGVFELRLPAGTLTAISPGVVSWEPSEGGISDGE
ncbi:hypothetical protein EON83_17255 [bacterium]|nr:MAG: hypothetical protein EON83_17255 [bacterium]